VHVKKFLHGFSTIFKTWSYGFK